MQAGLEPVLKEKRGVGVELEIEKIIESLKLELEELSPHEEKVKTYLSRNFDSDVGLLSSYLLKANKSSFRKKEVTDQRTSWKLTDNKIAVSDSFLKACVSLELLGLEVEVPDIDNLYTVTDSFRKISKDISRNSLKRRAREICDSDLVSGDRELSLKILSKTFYPQLKKLINSIVDHCNVSHEPVSMQKERKDSQVSLNEYRSMNHTEMLLKEAGYICVINMPCFSEDSLVLGQKFIIPTTKLNDLGIFNKVLKECDVTSERKMEIVDENIARQINLCIKGIPKLGALFDSINHSLLSGNDSIDLNVSSAYEGTNTRAYRYLHSLGVFSEGEEYGVVIPNKDLIKKVRKFSRK